MVLEYKTHITFELLAPILEEYAAWFSDIAFSVAYLEDLPEESHFIPMPNSFHHWLQNPQTTNNINQFILHDMTKAHEDMTRIAALLMTRLNEGEKPLRHDFEDFKNLYNAFLMRLRRLEKDSAYEGSGIDPQTGLRSQNAFLDDMKEEMERLGRQGNPFCLVMANIDMWDDLKDQKKIIEVVTRSVKKCMRSFDDAYSLGQGEFILSLKHADKIGGKAAINRLQAYLEYDEDNKAGVTMSYCLFEPTIGDDISKMLGDMRQDLKNHTQNKNIVLELSEISALERYASKL